MNLDHLRQEEGGYRTVTKGKRKGKGGSTEEEGVILKTNFSGIPYLYPLKYDKHEVATQ